MLLLLSHFSRVQLCVTPWQQPIRLLRPWDSPGKNTGVGCHFLLQCMKLKSESEVTQSCPTLSDPMDWSPPGSSVHGISQARVLEQGAIAFSVPFYRRFHSFRSSFCRLHSNWSYRLKWKCWQGCILSGGSRRQSISLPVQLLEAAYVPWLVDPHSIFKKRV